MQHTLNLTPEELELYPGKGYIIMKHDPLMEPGDTILLTYGREQIPMTVTHIETTPHVYKGWAVVGLEAIRES